MHGFAQCRVCSLCILPMCSLCIARQLHTWFTCAFAQWCCAWVMRLQVGRGLWAVRLAHQRCAACAAAVQACGQLHNVLSCDSSGADSLPRFPTNPNPKGGAQGFLKRPKRKTAVGAAVFWKGGIHFISDTWMIPAGDSQCKPILALQPFFASLASRAGERPLFNHAARHSQNPKAEGRGLPQPFRFPAAHAADGLRADLY